MGEPPPAAVNQAVAAAEEQMAKSGGGGARAGLAGFLVVLDGFLAYEDYQAVKDFNAENAAYADELKAIAKLNAVLLAHPRSIPLLAGRNCKMSKEECWSRYLQEKAFCEQYYGTVMYGMCRDRAKARYEACRDGLDPNGPGPLDPLDPNSDQSLAAIKRISLIHQELEERLSCILNQFLHLYQSW